MTTICRACLIESSNSIDLSQTLFINGKNIDLCYMLSVCTGLEVQEIDDDDEITHQICVDCMNKTINSYSFRQKVLESNAFLKQSKIDSLKSIKNEIVMPETVEDTENLSIDYLEEIEDQEIEYIDPIELSDQLISETKIEPIESESENLSKPKPKALKKPRKKYVRNESVYVCPYCGKVCRGTGNYHQHVRTHTGEKPYKCDLCDYKCGHSTALKLHKKSHFDDKPLVCPYEGCTKAYKVPSQIAEHRRVHEPPQFECKTCLKKFHKKVSYNDHIKIHDFDKYIQCDFCDKKFAKRESVRKHQQNVHKEQYEEKKRLALLQSK